jgi:hypothetical protein
MRVIVALGGQMPFCETDVDTIPLGGTEHTTIKLVQALRRIGMDVTLLTEHVWCAGEGYLHVPHPDRPDFYRTAMYDAVIFVNNAMPGVVDVIPEDRVRVLWSHHCTLCDTPAKNIPYLDRIVALSSPARARIQAALPMEERHKVVAICQGIELERYGLPLARNRFQGVYCSVPNRGLSLLIDWAEDLIALDERLRIVVCSGWEIYSECEHRDYPRGQLSDVDDDRRTKMEPYRGRLFLGGQAVPYPDLPPILCRSSILTYPCTKFDESLCLAAMFAQAAGCVVLTTGSAALEETAATQVLIPEHRMHDGTYKGMFLHELDRLLHDDAYWEYYHRLALVMWHHPGVTWAVRAQQWYALLTDVLDEKKGANTMGKPIRRSSRLQDDHHAEKREGQTEQMQREHEAHVHRTRLHELHRLLRETDDPGQIKVIGREIAALEDVMLVGG